MSNFNFAMLAVVLVVVACCAVDALFRRRNGRIGVSENGANVGDGGTSFDCGGGDGGGCD